MRKFYRVFAEKAKFKLSPDASNPKFQSMCQRQKIELDLQIMMRFAVHINLMEEGST